MKYQDNPEVPGLARNVLGTSAFLSQGLDVVQTGSLRSSATVLRKVPDVAGPRRSKWQMVGVHSRSKGSREILGKSLLFG